jgi:hypothetical protein
LRNRYGFRKIYGKSYLEQGSARNRQIKCEQKYFHSNLISASVSSNDFVSFVVQLSGVLRSIAGTRKATRSTGGSR